MSTIEMEARLIEKAVEERNKLLERAQERANRILNNARNEEQRIRSDTERHMGTIVGSELRAVRDRIIGKENLEGRRKLMSAKTGLIDNIFMEAEKQLKNLASSGSDEYNAILLTLIVEASQAIDADNVIVSANTNDLEYLKENLKEVKKTLGETSVVLGEPIDTIGGVVLSNMEATKTYHNTLEGLLAKVRRLKESEVAVKLGVA